MRICLGVAVNALPYATRACRGCSWRNFQGNPNKRRPIRMLAHKAVFVTAVRLFFIATAVYYAA
eukprot:953482-Pleurochrysis_carterae.AAC.1